MNPNAVIERTRRWIDTFVIGLNLCPFAEQVFAAERIRYAVTDAPDEARLAERLSAELDLLASRPAGEVETTLLIHPLALADFLAYNDFLNVADELLQRLGLGGVIQIASFHPRYRFAGTDADAVENFTNRSPYPMLHLLREASITEAAAAGPPLDDIPRRNVAALRRLGPRRVRQLLGSADCGPPADQTNTRLL
jgi:hypothetical protein